MVIDILRKRAFLKAAFQEAIDLDCGDVAACVLRSYLKDIFTRRLAPADQRLIEADLLDCARYAIEQAGSRAESDLPFDTAEEAVQLLFELHKDEQRKELNQLIYALTLGM